MNGIAVDKLPHRGLVLAYFRDKLVFSPYSVEENELVTDEIESFERECPEECHFFDHDTEYRLIQRHSRGDAIELILTIEEEKEFAPDLLFAEDVLVKKEYAGLPGIPEKLRVTSRYRYSENDTLVLDMYRIGTIV